MVNQSFCSASKFVSIEKDEACNRLIWGEARKNHISVFDETGFDYCAGNPQTIPEGHIIGHIHAIHTDHDDNLWAGSCYTGLSIYNGDNQTHNVNNLNSFINTIYCASVGDIWAGQSPQGAFRYSMGDNEGNIWVGWPSGISKIFMLGEKQPR